MKFSQKLVILVYALAVAAACLYVPWQADLDGMTRDLGYGPIWTKPSDYPTLSDVNYPRVVLEIVAITATAGAAFVVTVLVRPRR